MLVWVLLVLSVSASDDDDSEDDHRRVYDPDKSKPVKGDPSCKSWEERVNAISQGDIIGFFQACRGEDSSDDPADENFACSDDSDDSNSDDEGDNGEPVPVSAVTGAAIDNSVRFNVFLAVPPHTPSLGHILRVAVTMYLNVTSTEYRYRLRQLEEDAWSRSQPHGNLFKIALDLINEFIGGLRKPPIANLYLIDSDPKIVHYEKDRWWWKYRFRYNSFWHDGKPMLNTTMRQRIKRHTLAILDAGISTLHEGILDEIGTEFGLNSTDTFFEVSVRKPSVLPGCGRVDPGPSPTASPTVITEIDQVVSPLDTSEWDWRRYFGLAMLLGTVVVTFCLVQLAGLRRRRMTRKEVWSNIATEEGVEELLRTGWKLRGSQMEVYDKKNAGYRDDDSMLIGGFEQCEIVGAEITVTQPESETTP